MKQKKPKVSMNKRFVIKKYIFAKSAIDAIKKDKRTPVDDVWVDEQWHKEFGNRELSPAIGFVVQQEDEDEE